LASSRRVTLVEGGLLVVGFLVLFVLLPHDLKGDDYARFNEIELLLHHGELSDGRYSLVMPLLSAPFLLLGEVVRTPMWWAAHFNVMAVALGTVVFLGLFRGRVDGALLRRSLLVLLFASLLTNRLRDYNAEVLTATLVSIGLVLVTTGRRVFTGWTAVVIGVVNTPAALLGAILVAVAESIRTKRLRHLLVPVAAAVLIMAEAWIRRGGPLTTGYEHDHGLKNVLPYSGRSGFSYPFVLGLLVRIQHANELGLGNALTLLLLTLSGWVGVSGAIADLSALDYCTRGNSAHEYLCWYAPEFSSLWHPLVDFPALTWKTTALAVYCGLVFVYLAWPVIVALTRSVRAAAPRQAWATGWRL
jgi:hypothetical protein